MSFLNRLQSQRKDTHQRDVYANKPDAWVGAVVNGSNQILAPNGPAWIWATINKGDQRGPALQVINRTISPVFDLPIMLGVNKMGQPYVMDVADSQVDPYSSGNSGGSSNSFRTPPHSHEYGMGNYDLVSDRRLREGLIWWRSVDGPLVVYMNEYWYYDASGQQQYYAGGTLDVTLLLTVTSGQHQWIKLGFDPVAAAPVGVAGSASSVIAPLLSADLAAISFAGYIPIRGLQVTYGQAISGEGDFTDISNVRSGPAERIGGRTPTATDYVMKPTDVLVGVTSTASARAITLPPVATTPVGQMYVVKDESGGAATHNITVSPASGNIDGAGSKVISTNYGFVRAYTDGVNWFTT